MSFIAILTVFLLLLMRTYRSCTSTNNMEEILKTIKCKIDEVEGMWSNVRNENAALKLKLEAKEGKWGLEANKNRGVNENAAQLGKYVMSREGLVNGSVTVAVLVDTEKENEKRVKPQSQLLVQEEGRRSQFVPPEEEDDSRDIQLTSNLMRQNEQLKMDLKQENELLKNELKNKSDILRKDLVDENEQLKADMKTDNELFKEELQKENELLIVELRRENEELKVDLKNKGQQLKEKMRKENEDLKNALKRENEQLKVTLKEENEKLKISLKNQSEHLKLELKRENDLLKTQLEQENEELMVQLQDRNDEIRMALRNKTEELQKNLEEEFLHINKTLKMLEKRNNLQNYTLLEVKRKISKLLTYCQMLSPDICGACTCADDFEQEEKYYCDCTNLKPRKDCLQHLDDGNTMNGVYTIHVVNYKTMNVYCDQRNGGWILIQRRMNGKLVFYQNWDKYKNGFGDIEREFWIGNDNLNVLTSSRDINPIGAELRVDMTDWSNKKVYAIYKVFKVDQENSNYKLHVSSYKGTAGNSLSYHNNMMFSTPDRDNDHNIVGECSKSHRGPWWHRDCHESNLNGEYLKSNKRHNASPSNIIWRTYKGYKYSLKHVEMKIRRKA